ncbi:hypothetical protein AEA09_09170 [Lysinibacillus contaminans]|uniref:Uncharacterized protein n=1 Tax=Lysinibacillus contaminans TaxID=1293441 RepID=A0ABR5K1T3_9BACI|nr:hypothetical protein [Lysinibacillus contaminans]KOS68694.1 hypothetical protein AEA09_09170 [Lysinibacillus contaminans]
MYKIRHINVPVEGSDLFVTAEFEKKVTLWSLASKKKLSEFDTILDCGEQRMVLIPFPSPIVVTAAYYRKGVAAYDGLTGEKLWHRKDLTKVQFVNRLIINDEIVIGLGRDQGPYTVLNLSDGSTKEQIRGVRRIFTDNEGSKRLVVKDSQDQLIDVTNNKVLFKDRINPVRVEFLDEQFVVNTYKKIACYDFEGQIVWQYNCPERHILHNLSRDVKEDEWLIILRNSQTGGPVSICRINDSGVIVSEKILGNVFLYEFIKEGEVVITSDGEVRNTDTLSVEWKFCNKLIQNS